MIILWNLDNNLLKYMIQVKQLMRLDEEKQDMQYWIRMETLLNEQMKMERVLRCKQLETSPNLLKEEGLLTM